MEVGKLYTVHVFVKDARDLNNSKFPCMLLSWVDKELRIVLQLNKEQVVMYLGMDDVYSSYANQSYSYHRVLVLDRVYWTSSFKKENGERIENSNLDIVFVPYGET